MAIRIIKRDGLDAGRVVAVWEEGKGFVESEPGLRFTDDDVYEEYSPEQMLEEFGGPDHFAVPEGETADTTKSAEPPDTHTLSSFGGGDDT